jgi:cysteine desulfurase
VSIGAHKFEGPKGIGALYLRSGTHILAQQHGGSQERHRRAGTEDVASAVGMAVALDLACEERSESSPRLRRMRDRLRSAVVTLDGVEVTGHPRNRLPNHLSIIARDTDGTAVSLALDLEGIEVSTGSACTSGSAEVSHVLTAVGYPVEEARGALRLTVGRTTTDAEVEVASEAVARVIAAQREGGRAMVADAVGQVTPV